ncbi:tripartite tricarboxylate transporter substrate binding protein [Shumkonia mesophila]|uniref:tripartite tricarboxylate transporter substrate binding protein n=1 Tax=Shumkonia mesophila TaxID=2838854 RepID=UPI00293477C7|nr:tripartite tricarboxylate transporter substrate binding protein [Shumkonia mesophila]
MRLSNKMAAAVATVLALSIGQAGAVDWPQKPITLIIGWAQGGGADITSRAVFQPHVEDILGQKIIIRNQTGAGGEVSFTTLAHSKPDGYTFGWTVTPNLLSFPISRKTNYKFEDLVPVVNVSYDPGVFVVPADSQFNSLKDLAAYAKDNPDKVTIANGGTGGDDFIAVELFMTACNCQVTQVAYAEGTGASISGLLGKHVMVSAINATESKKFQDAGQVKVLGVMADKRVDIIPNVPTFREQGFDVISGSYRGFSAPAGTPDEIVQKMADAVEETMKKPEFLDRAKKLQLILEYIGPKDYKKFLLKVEHDMKKIYAKHPW